MLTFIDLISCHHLLQPHYYLINFKLQAIIDDYVRYNGDDEDEDEDEVFASCKWRLYCEFI